MSKVEAALMDSVVKQLGMPNKTWLEQGLKNVDLSQQEGLLQICLFNTISEFEKYGRELTEGSLSWQRRFMQDKKQQ